MNTQPQTPLDPIPSAPPGREPYPGDWSNRLRRVAWGAILGGFFAAVAIQLLLSLLGLAVGFWSIDPVTENAPLSGLGTGAYLWWLVTGVIALFVGGCIAGRAANFADRTDALLQGVIVWGLMTVVGFWTAGSAFGTVISATTSAVSTSLQLVGSGIQAVGRGGAMLIPDASGGQSGNGNQGYSAMRVPTINYERVGSELNKILSETGKESLQPDELQTRVNAVEKVARQAAMTVLRRPDSASQQIDRVLNEFYSQVGDVREAVDKEAVVNVLTANTDMNEAEARKVVNRWRDEYEDASQAALKAQARLEEEMAELGQEIQSGYQQTKKVALQTTDEALDMLAYAAFWSFLALTCGLGAAAWGGYMGPKTIRHHA